jgi:hypothetical protein
VQIGAARDSSLLFRKSLILRLFYVGTAWFKVSAGSDNCLVRRQLERKIAARTGVEPNFNVSRNCAILTEACINQWIKRALSESALC